MFFFFVPDSTVSTCCSPKKKAGEDIERVELNDKHRQAEREPNEEEPNEQEPNEEETQEEPNEQEPNFASARSDEPNFEDPTRSAMVFRVSEICADPHGVEAIFIREIGAEPKKVIFTRRPIGLGFAHVPPFLVLEAGGHAAELGVEVGMELCSVGHVDLVGKRAVKPSKIAKLIHEQTTVLPLKQEERKRRSSLFSLSSDR